MKAQCSQTGPSDWNTNQQSDAEVCSSTFKYSQTVGKGFHMMVITAKLQACLPETTQHGNKALVIFTTRMSSIG